MDEIGRFQRSYDARLSLSDSLFPDNEGSTEAEA